MRGGVKKSMREVELASGYTINYITDVVTRQSVS